MAPKHPSSAPVRSNLVEPKVVATSQVSRFHQETLETDPRDVCKAEHFRKAVDFAWGNGI
jgi:hypothetical protein